MNAILTIAGSDCSGGAGIQADLKTIMAHGAYGMSVITALTAQNTCGVSGVLAIDPAFIAAQLDAVFTDIKPSAVKTGMITDAAAVHVICEKLRIYQVKNVVADTVLASTSGTALMKGQALRMAEEELFPLADLLTPNIPEAEVLSGISIKGKESMQDAAEFLARKFGCAVLCKGGHLADTADDLLYDHGKLYWLEQKKIDNPNTHGTGCTLSSAIACNLADGMGMADAVKRAKLYITGAIRSGLDLGHGNGPLNHGYGINFNNYI